MMIPKLALRPRQENQLKKNMVQTNWMAAGVAVSIILLLLLIYWVNNQKVHEESVQGLAATQCPSCPICSPCTTTKENDSSLALKTRAAVAETRKIFPVGAVVLIKSKNSGKYLRFVEEKEAKENPDLRSEAGLVLEATGEDAQDQAAQWKVMDLLPFQPADAQGITIRLENTLYQTYLREVELEPLSKQSHPLGQPQYTFQSGVGSQISSPIVAARVPEGVLIAGYTMFRTTGQPTLTVDNPFLLRASIEGLILPPPRDPVGNEAYWEVSVVPEKS